MKLPRLAAALALSAALFTAGCCNKGCRKEGCCASTASAPPCGCNGPAGPVPTSPYPPNVLTAPPPGATIIHQ